MSASKSCDIKVVTFLLDNGADLNVQNKTGFTPLHHAVENNQKNTVILLIKANADVSLANVKGNRPIDTAILKKNNAIIDLLK